jgi:cell cycle sensor histidine kinase DivJ
MPGEGTVVTVLLPINGPETKLEETAAVTPLRRETIPAPQPASQISSEWPDERKRAL